ncbi:MAG: Do family serine endopeptidase [Bacteroidales bacterium]|nr:Do family serine endopeptidase [Bacteroidales bacterium]
MKKGFITVLFSVVLSAITAYGVVKACNPSEPAQTPAGTSGVEYRTVNLAESDYPDFTYAAESAVDAVVYVEVTVQSRRQDLQIDPFFRFFFGDEFGQQQSPREQKGSGSGVIIRPDGYIVTNNHVVANATKVGVTLNNDKVYEATVVGTDPATDVAILKIDAEGLPTIPFGDSDKLRLGEWVLAIGSPLSYNLRSTITAGIVSAKGRSMPNTSGEFKIESFIQTDAAVNPGNSGGALVNKEGELVGINTAIISQTGAYSGYSFAVPVNIVKKIADDLIDYGSVKRAVLGITMQPIDDKIAKELKLSSLAGVYIYEVSKGGAAEKAGLRKGDVIIAIDGTKVKDGASVQEKVNSYHPGDKATVTYIRDGKEHQVEVTFQGTAAATGEKDIDGTTAFYGSKIKAASPETLSALGLRGGVEIVSVGPGKVLDAGAVAGFIIQYVNDEPVSKPEEVIEIARKAKRSVFIQGITPEGKSSYFGFGKE